MPQEDFSMGARRLSSDELPMFSLFFLAFISSLRSLSRKCFLFTTLQTTYILLSFCFDLKSLQTYLIAFKLKCNA